MQLLQKWMYFQPQTFVIMDSKSYSYSRPGGYESLRTQDNIGHLILKVRYPLSSSLRVQFLLRGDYSNEFKIVLLLCCLLQSQL